LTLARSNEDERCKIGQRRYKYNEDRAEQQKHRLPEVADQCFV